MKIRVGMGFDVHRLVENRDLWLCGVKIPHSLGLLGHSDADVAIHALCDALLGAANLRDIGYHFPDTDPRYKGADSRKLLIEVVRILGEKGYSFGNADITIPVAAVVGLTLAFVAVVAKLVGGLLPMGAKKLGFDPAVMASPFITTIVDALSLLLYFTIASLLLGL